MLGFDLTDIARFRSGDDDVLKACDFGVPTFAAKIRQYAPRAVTVNGKRVAEIFYGCRARGGSYVFRQATIDVTANLVLPSTPAAVRGFWSSDRRLAVAGFAGSAI